MRCFVQIASIRRSLFNAEPERGKFLLYIMDGIREILASQQVLSTESRLKSTGAQPTT